MQKLGKHRIGRRIVALVLLSVALSIVTLTASFLWLQLRDSIDTRRAGIQATGYVFASAVADPMAAGDRQAVFNALRSMRRIPDLRYALAIDAEGREIASLGAVAMLTRDIVDGDAGWFSVLTRGWFPVSIEIVRAGRPVGRLIIVADVSGLRSQVAWASLITLIVALAAGGLGVLAAVRLQKRITAPIASLVAAMTHIRGARDYTTKVQYQADDEVGVLVDSFNGMMQEIGYRDETLKRMAYFDALTGLPNRQSFQRHLDALLLGIAESGGGAALYLLDLDEFKTINDSYGHAAGDSLLMDVAARLKSECGPEHFLVRLGGDEFALMVDGVNSEAEAQSAIAPFIASLCQPVHIVGRQILIGASIGAALIPQDGATAADLLRRADLALYQAKQAGRGRVHFFEPSLDEDMRSRTALAQDLRQAIELGQLRAFYQPQVDIHRGRVVGFESLLRWQHPEHGFVPPAKFIPIAESNGLICDLGHWMLRESCRQARAWIDEDHGARQISVNVSVAQILQSDFDGEVASILRETGLAPENLCLELTESLFAGTSLPRIRHVLNTLKGLGVKLALDDFGTGYSSLAYLHELPFEKLKIDRSFVSGAGEATGKHRLLRGIVELGRTLKLEVVAEGAETEAEVTVLRGMRVDGVQGYVYGRPAPADEAIRQTADLEASFAGAPSRRARLFG